MDGRSTERQPGLRAAIVKRGLQMLIGTLFEAAILFVAAGRLDWPMAWAYLGVFVAVLVVNGAIALRTDPELIAERGETKENTKGWDKVITSLITLSWLGTLLVAGLDRRFTWSPWLALAWQVGGLAAIVLGYAIASWAMLSNRFFSRVVRIQDDRGQTVATGGPYAWVRHPGYAGMILYSLATAPALGSLWALVPAGLGALALVARTALEDHTLHEELDGYREYAARVRYRLLPGVW